MATTPRGFVEFTDGDGRNYVVRIEEIIAVRRPVQGRVHDHGSVTLRSGAIHGLYDDLAVDRILKAISSAGGL